MSATNEIIVDNFAGGGGASTGIKMATGRSPHAAINHDPAAIAMHRANHPEGETIHYCESVWDVDPHNVAAGRPVGLVWLSPDCRHFSKAKGSTPVSKKIRGLAWVALRWAGTVRPRVIMLENVEEFRTWGPLLRDETGATRPNPKKKGKTFRSFVNALRYQGYDVEWRELRACDYGAPTIRKRFFLVARCDSNQIVWPEPTHGAPESLEVKSGKLLPWKTAADCIDWTIPCPSIFTRKRPLAEATLRRIARGIKKFVQENDTPYLVSGGQPFITECANASMQRNMSISEPLRTVVAQVKGGHFALVQAFLAKHYTGVVGADLRSPMPTVTTKDHNALVTSHLIKLRGTCQHGQPSDQPMATVTAGGMHIGEVRTLLHRFNDAAANDDMLGTVRINGELYQIVDIGMRMLEPHELFTAQGFPADYVIDRDDKGNRFTKTAQVARCGNAVCPPMAAALVRANLPDLHYADEYSIAA